MHILTSSIIIIFWISPWLGEHEPGISIRKGLMLFDTFSLKPRKKHILGLFCSRNWLRADIRVKKTQEILFVYWSYEKLDIIITFWIECYVTIWIECCVEIDWLKGGGATWVNNSLALAWAQKSCFLTLFHWSREKNTFSGLFCSNNWLWRQLEGVKWVMRKLVRY